LAPHLLTSARFPKALTAKLQGEWFRLIFESISVPEELSGPTRIKTTDEQLDRSDDPGRWESRKVDKKKSDETYSPIGHVAARAVLRGLQVLRAPFQISKRTAGEATEFSRSGVELFGVIRPARLEFGEPPAETGELIRRQLGNSFGDFFDVHVAKYSIERLG
jgi:hypothetical protein